MNSVILVKRLSVCLLLLSVAVTACRKKYAYNFEDGTPGDGALVSSITVDTSIKNVDASKYAQARVFPGLVCASEPRTKVDLAMNLNYNHVQDELRISVPPSPQFSTGLYAAPGELVIIDVPQNEYSLSVQIGAWTDNLSLIQNSPRDPVIVSRSQLTPGRNYFRNLYGGHIYIYAGRPLTTPVNLSFTNVVKSPDYILGQTDRATWEAAIRSSCVPWVELRSANMIFVVPRQYCIDRPFADIQKAMQDWDDIINIDYYLWEGLSASPVEAIDKAPLLPWRIVMDIKPSVGYGHSGFPIVVQNDYSWFDGIGNVTNINGGGNWGYLHEVGHNNQQGTYWSWSTLGEVTCNLFSFKVANRLSAITPSAWPPKHPALATAIPGAITWAASAYGTRNFDGADAAINDPFARLTPFVQIFSKIPANWGYPGQPDGWSFMTELYKKTRRSNRISITDQNKRDFVYETLCEFTRKDWKLFFKAWGITVSSISLNKMAALYPLMDQEISTYNPLTRVGGNESSYYYRRNWVAITTNSWATNEPNANVVPVTRLLDGDFTSYWHSNYGTGTGPQSPNANTGNPAGYWIAVDMGKSLPVKGVKFALRQSGTGVTTVVKNIKVEVSNDNTTWTLADFSTVSPRGAGFVTLATTNPLGQPFQGFQSFNFATNLTFRYFRVSIPLNTDNGTTAAGAASSALSEMDIIQP
jgi:hypothetical protein